jgi:hypothetical protein
LLGISAGSNITTGSTNVAIGSFVHVADGTDSCQLAIGFAIGCNWLTGNSTKAIQPGAGIIDCDGSCGTAGQVLMSNGANAICWGTVSGGSGTVTSITAGTGLTGGTITGSGTVALDTTCVIQPSVFTAKGDIISASAASTPTALSVGTDGQVLTACSACASGLTWAVSGGGGASPATPLVLGTVFGCTVEATNGNQIIGYCAATAISGVGNAIFGACALGCCTATNVNNNVAIGTWAMLNVSSAISCNVAVGFRALGGANGSLSGNSNIGIGNAAGGGILSGSCNIVIGPGNGSPSTGCANIIIGAGAQTTAALTGSNNTVIGFGAATTSGTVSNTINLGNFSVTVIRAAVTTITAISDARDKTDIIDLPIGLDFIRTLRPVKFTWNHREKNEVKDGTSEAGFIAQELKSAQESAGVEDYLGLVYDEDPDRLEASPGKLIPVLVNAIKELSAKNDALEARIAALEGK